MTQKHQGLREERYNQELRLLEVDVNLKSRDDGNKLYKKKEHHESVGGRVGLRRMSVQGRTVRRY